MYVMYLKSVCLTFQAFVQLLYVEQQELHKDNTFTLNSKIPGKQNM